MLSFLLMLSLCQVVDQPLSRTSFVLERSGLLLSPETQTILATPPDSEDTTPVSFDLSYDAPLTDAMRIRATLLGPGLAAPYEVDVPASNSRIDLPRTLFSTEGIYRLSNVRLERNGQVEAFADPRTAEIQVAEQFLVSEVKVTPLSKDDLIERGYLFSDDDYYTVEFELALMMGSKKEEVKVPVAFPKKGLDEFKPPVIIEDPFKPYVRLLPIPPPYLPSIKLLGGTDGPENGTQGDAYIPGLIAIPGNFQYLKSHFEVTCLVLNTAPEGFDVVAERLKAELVLPPANNGPLPLRVTQSVRQDVVNLGEDATLGTADDRETIRPGEEGQASYVVIGEAPGMHDVTIKVHGDLHLGQGTERVELITQGQIFVRSPEFTVDFEHPDAVRQGDAYDLVMRLNNKGEVPLEDFSVTLDQELIVGAELLDSPTQNFPSIPAGGEATITYRLRALVSGRAIASYVKTDVPNSVATSLTLRVGIGNLGERYSPYVISYPQIFYQEFPNRITSEIRGLAKTALDFSQMREDELPVGQPAISATAVRDFNKQIAFIARSGTLGQTDQQQLSRLLVMWLRSVRDYGPLDGVRRRLLTTPDPDAPTQMLSDAEADFGAVLAANFPSSQAAAMLEMFAQENEDANNLFAAVVEASAGVELDLVHNGQSSNSAGLRDVPFASLLPLGTNRYLVLASAVTETPQLRMTRSDSQTATNVTVHCLFPAQNQRYLAQTSSLELEEGLRVSFDPATQQLQVQPNLGPPQSFAARRIQPKPFELLNVQHSDPTLLGSSDNYGRDVIFSFSKSLDLGSLEPLEEHLFINDKPVVDAVLQTDNRTLIVSSKMPLGPYRDIRYSLRGARSRDGQNLPNLNGTFQGSSYYVGVTVSGRVVDRNGADLNEVEVLHFKRDPLHELKWNVMERTGLNADGSFDFDFSPFPPFPNSEGEYAFPQELKIGVLMPDGRYQEREFMPLGAGQNLIAEFAFLQQGEVRGRVMASAGDVTTAQPVPLAQVYVVNQNDPQSAVLTETDLNGYYRAEGLEVGPILVKSASARIVGYASGYLTQGNSPLTVDVLIDRPTAQFQGFIAVDDNGVQKTLERAYVGFTLQNGLTATLRINNSTSFQYTVLTQTDADGRYVLEDVPAGNGFWWVYYPGLGYHERLKVLNPGDYFQENQVYELRLPDTGAVEGIVENHLGVRLQGASVTLGGQLTTTDANGSYRFEHVEVGKLQTLSANFEGLRSKSSSIFPEGDLTQAPTIVLRPQVEVSGTLVDINDRPIPHAFIYSPPNWAFDAALAQTNAQGEWSATLPEPGTYVFTALEWPQIIDSGLLNISEEGMHGIRLKPRQNADIRVEVVDEAGEPMDAKVFAMSELPSSDADVLGRPEYITSHNSIFTSTIDRDGRGVAYLRGVNAGPFEVYARDPFRGDSETFHGVFDPQSPDDEQLITLVIPNTLPPANLFGRVLSPDGVSAAPEGTFVQVSGAEINASTYVNAQGSYRFETLVSTATPVTLTVIAYNPDQDWFTHAVINLSNDINFRNDLVLNGQGDVTVTVVDENNVPVDVAAVTSTYTGIDYTPPVPPEEFGNLKVVTRATQDPLQITENNPIITFENIPAGTFTLQVNSRGLVGLRTFTMPLQGADLNVSVPVEAASSVSGEFVDRLNERIGGAEVQLLSGSELLSQRVTSDLPEEPGLFSFTGLPMRTYRLRGTDPRDAQRAHLTVTTSPYEPDPFVTLRIDPTAELTGIVYHEGQGVPNARIKLQARGFEIITGTNAEGRYRFVNIPFGSYSIVADTAALAGKVRSSVTLNTEGVTVQDLYYSASLDVSLAVLSSVGQPVPNMLVTVMNEDYREVVGNSAFTDSDGIAHLSDLPPGRYRAVGEDPEEPLALWDHFTITEADPEPIQRSVAFKGHGGVTGRVLQSTGEPLTTPATVTIIYEFGAYYEYTIITNDDGSFRLGRIPDGVRVSVTAYNEETRETANERVFVAAGQDTQVDLTFQASTFVSGIVRYQDGSPAAFAEITVNQPFNMNTRADAGGEFFLRPILEGTTTFKAKEENGPRQGDAAVVVSVVDNVPQPVRNVEIVLGGVAELSGNVAYFGGIDPVRAGTVSLEHQTTGATYTTLIQGDGAYQFAQVPLGTYDLVARDPKYDRRTEALVVVLDQDQSSQTQDIEYPESYNFSGTVMLANGVDPAVLAVVKLYYPDSRNSDNWRLVYLDETDNDGYFQVEHVYASKATDDVYLLVIEDAGQSMRLEQTFYMPAQPTSQTFQLNASAWLTGNLADAEGNPFSEGSITATQSGRTVSAELNDNGGFRLNQLATNAFTTIQYRVANGWLTGSDSLITQPGNNLYSVRTVPTATLSGRAILVEGGATHPSVSFVNASGISRGVRLAADGSYALPYAPIGSDITMVLRYGYAVKYVDFTVSDDGNGEMSLGTVYLDPIAPNVSFADDGLAVTSLPYTMTFAIDEPHPGSQVDPAISRVWVNSVDISAFFDRGTDALTATFNELPDGFTLGVNQLEVEVGNDSNAKRRQTFSIDLDLSTVTVAVQLLQNQTPVAGLFKLDSGDFVATDANGRFELEGMTPGAYTFKGRGNGLGARRRVEVGSALLQQVNLQLGAVGTYRGRVVDGNDLPVANAAIYVGEEVEFSDAQGNYVFDLLPLNNYQMVAEAVVDNAQRIGFAVPARLAFNGQSVDVDDIVLEAPSTVRGFVYDDDGPTPIANAAVTLSVDGLPDSFDRSATSDASGAFELQDVIARRNFSVVAQDPVSGRSGVAQGISDTPGETLALDIQLTPAGDLRGVLLAADGLAAFEQDVRLVGNGTNQTVTTGLDGTFSFNNLRYGAYRLFAEDRDAGIYLPEQSIDLNANQLDLGDLQMLEDQAPQILAFDFPTPYDLASRPGIIVDLADDRDLDRLVITYTGAYEGSTVHAFNNRTGFQGSLAANIPGDAAVGEVNWVAELFDNRDLSAQVSGTTQLSFVGSEPQVVIDRPVLGDSFAEGSSFEVQVSVSDLVGISEVAFYLDGSLQTTLTRAPYEAQISLPLVSQRTPLEVEVVATNVRGQQARADVQIFVNPAVTEGAPEISLVAPQFQMPLPLAYEGLEVHAAADISDPDGFERAWLYVGDQLIAEQDMSALSDCGDGACRLTLAGQLPLALRTADQLEVRLEVSDQGGNIGRAFSEIVNLPIDAQTVVRDAASPAQLGPGDVRIDGIDLADVSLILAGGEHVIDGSHPLRNLVLINGASLTQSRPDINFPDQIQPMRLSVSNEVVIDYAASIDLDGKGYGQSQKPVNYAYPGPPSHGGIGASSTKDASDLRLIYGSPFHPQMYGSNNGGGALQLSSRNIWLVGDLTADAGNYSSTTHGSGGSLWLNFERFAGRGRLSANGYQGNFASSGVNGGGGGRIALYGPFPAQASATTFGGRGAGAGTVYVRRPDSGTVRGYRDSLIVANHPDSTEQINHFTAIRTLQDLQVGADSLVIENRTVTNVTRQVAEFRDGTLLPQDSFLGMTLYPAGGTPGVTEIEIQTFSDLRTAAEESFGEFQDGDLVNVGYRVDEMIVANGARFHLEGHDIQTQPIQLQDAVLIGGEQPVNLAENGLDLQDGAHLSGHFIFNQDLTIDQTLFLEGRLDVPAGTLTITATGSLQTPVRPQKGRIELNGANLVIAGEVQVFGDRGPGDPHSYSHGGHGSITPTNHTTYGSFYQPTEPGRSHNNAWEAGGVFHADFDAISLDGRVSANGRLDQLGAGGSVLLRANTLSGTGSVEANGSDHQGSYFVGGGGRVALYVDDISGFGDWRATDRIIARSGETALTTWLAGAGTIYLQDATYPQGLLRVDNGNASNFNDIDATTPGHRRLTVLPSLGTINATVTAEGHLQVADLPGLNDFVGMLVRVTETGDEVRVTAHTTETLFLETPLSSPGQNVTISGLHRLDRVEVVDGAILVADDRLEIGELQLDQGRLIAPESDLSTGLVFESGGRGVLDHDPGFDQLLIDTDYELVLYSALTLQQLDLRNGARLNLMNHLPIQATTINIDATSSIRSAYNPGVTNSSPLAFSHGGLGAFSFTRPNASGHGSMYYPTAPGFGNGGTQVGGVIHLIFDQLNLEGTLDVNGGTSDHQAGGSIFLQGQSIRGSGMIDAAGSDTYWGGGGGRVALHVEDLTGFGDWRGERRVEARGGNLTNVGGAGTIFVRNSNYPNGFLLIDNGDKAATLNPSAVMPAFGTRMAQRLDNRRLFVENLPAYNDLAGLYLRFPGDVEIEVVSHNQETLVMAQDIPEFSGQIEISGVHILDQVEILGTASIQTDDAVRITQILFLDGGLYTPELYVDGSTVFPENGIGNLTSLPIGESLIVDTPYQLNVAAPINLDSLSLTNGAELFTTGEVVAANQLTVGAGSAIRARVRQGFDPPTLYRYSHGGLGASSTQADATTHGSLYFPNQIGFDRSTSNTVGGILNIQFEDLQLDGIIEVNGVSNAAGGSLQLTGDRLSGAGQLQAHGGDTTYSGGGGRIALHVEDLSGFGAWFDEGRINARGGIRTVSNNAIFNGGCGTVFLTNSSYPNGWLLIDNNPGNNTSYFTQQGSTLLPGFGSIAMRFVDANTLQVADAGNFPEFFDYSGYTIQIPGQGNRKVLASNATSLTLATPIDSFAGNLTITATHVLDRLNVRNGASLKTVDGLQVLGEFSMDRGEVDSPNLDVQGTWTFPAGGEGSLYNNPGVDSWLIDTDYTLTLATDLVAQSFVLRNGAVLNVQQGQLQATSIEVDATSVIRSQIAQGQNVDDDYEFSHGGMGARNGRATRKAHGNLYAPQDRGFGNGTSVTVGGVVNLQFTELILNGRIEANGINASAGGSIWLTGDRITGGGAIEARGGNDTYAGGGGRVALHVEDLTGFGDWFAEGRVSARSGIRDISNNAIFNGGCGTVYIRNTTLPNGWLLVDNHPGGNTSYFTQEGSTPLPSIGTVDVTFVDANTLALADGASFPEFYNFTDYQVRIPGQGARRVISNSTTHLVLDQALVSFAGSLTIQGLHVFDRLDVRNGASLASDDEIQVLGEFHLERGEFDAAVFDLQGTWTKASGGSGSLLVDPSLSDWVIDSDYALTLKTPLQASNISLSNGAQLITEGHLIDANTIVVGAGASIGSQMRQDINVERVSEFSHGGIGASNGQASPQPHGGVYFPRMRGYANSSSSIVGGIVEIRFDQMTLDGSILANGESRTAGGSILLTGQSLSGSGLIEARGGYDTYAGGGGRVAVHVSDLSGFGDWYGEGRLSARGGIRTVSNNPVFTGGAGTVLVRSDNYPKGWLLLDNSPGNRDERWPTRPNTSPLPALGSVNVSFISATELAIPEGDPGIRSDFDLSGMFAVIPGVGEVPIASHGTHSITLVEPIASFAGTLTITALHDLDRMDVLGGASLLATDPIRTQALVVDDPNAFNANVQDLVAPVISTIEVLPMIAGAIDSAQEFEVRFDVTENLALRDVALTFNDAVVALEMVAVGSYRATITAPTVSSVETYALQINAVDFANNSDAQTLNVDVVPPDTEAPTPRLVSPAEGSHVDMETSFTTVLNADDNRAVRTIEATFNGQTQSVTLTNEELGQDVSFDWQAPLVARETEFFLDVVATDLAGNQTQPAQRFSLFVDPVVGAVQPILTSPVGRVMRAGDPLEVEVALADGSTPMSVTVTFEDNVQTLNQAPFRFSIPTPDYGEPYSADLLVTATAANEETGSAAFSFQLLSENYARPQLVQFAPQQSSQVEGGAPLFLGVMQSLFSDDFQQNNLHLWTTTNLGSGTIYDWTRSGTSWLDNDNYSTVYQIYDNNAQHRILQSPYLTPSNGSTLRFDYRVQHTAGSEGVQLHILPEGAETSIDLGPYMIAGGYNDTITFPGHVMEGQPAWTGTAQAQAVVDLSNWAGQSVQLQWIKVGDNQATSGNRFAFDNVSVTCGDSCGDLQILLDGQAMSWQRQGDFVTVTMPDLESPQSMSLNLNWPAAIGGSYSGQTWALQASAPTVTVVPDATAPRVTLDAPLENSGIDAGASFEITPVISDLVPVQLPLIVTRDQWTRLGQDGYWQFDEEGFISLELSWGEPAALVSRSYPVPAIDARFSFNAEIQQNIYYPSKTAKRMAADGTLTVTRLFLSADGGTTWLDAEPYLIDSSYDDAVEINGQELRGWVDAHSHHIDIDLSSFAGQTVQFRFEAYRNDMTQLNWYLSDLRLSGFQTASPDRIDRVAALFDDSLTPLVAPDYNATINVASESLTGIVSLMIDAFDSNNNRGQLVRDLLVIGSDAVRSNALTVAAGDNSQDGSKLVLEAGEHRIDGTHNYADMFLLPGARLTRTPLTDNSQSGNQPLTIEGTLLVSEGAAIDFSGAGYSASVAHAAASGGSHGHAGLGADQTGGNYGDPFNPTTPGSNGGGGAVIIEANAIKVEGEIRADGIAANGRYGSGGTINLTAETITGSGTLSASGTGSQALPGGGGGRIALLSYEHSFSGTLAVSGGSDAGGGTIFDQAGPTLTVTGGDAYGNATPLPDLADVFVNQLVVDHAHAVVNGHVGYEGSVVVQDGHLAITEPNQIDLSWRLTANNARLEGNLLLSGELLSMGDEGSYIELVGTIEANDSVVLGQNADGPIFDKRRMPEEPVQRNQLFLAGTLTAPSLRLTGNSRLSSIADLPNEPLHLDIGFALTIDDSAAICACNGAGQDDNLFAHAGEALGSDGQPTGTTYGSLYRPTTPGGDGGVIHIEAPVLELRGAILAQAGGCDPDQQGPIFPGGLSKRAPGGVAGSGGSILIEVSSLSGYGTIAADGTWPDEGEENPVVPSGGRIAIYSNEDDVYLDGDGLFFSVEGGNHNGSHGAPGTVFVRSPNYPKGALAIGGTNWEGAYPEPGAPRVIMPGMGERNVSANADVDGSFFLEPDADFPANLAGRYWVDQNENRVLISENQSNGLVGETNFPAPIQGTQYWGVHDMDYMIVRWPVRSDDEIAFDGFDFRISEEIDILHVDPYDYLSKRRATVTADSTTPAATQNTASEMRFEGGSHVYDGPLNAERLILKTGTQLRVNGPLQVKHLILEEAQLTVAVSAIGQPTLQAGHVELRHAKLLADGIASETLIVDQHSQVEPYSQQNLVVPEQAPAGLATEMMHAGVWLTLDVARLELAGHIGRSNNTNQGIWFTGRSALEQFRLQRATLHGHVLLPGGHLSEAKFTANRVRFGGDTVLQACALVVDELQATNLTLTDHTTISAGETLDMLILVEDRLNIAPSVVITANASDSASKEPDSFVATTNYDSPLLKLAHRASALQGGNLVIRSKHLRLDGRIAARGIQSGAGGSLRIETDEVFGNGSIDVSGGADNATNGGRLALQSQQRFGFSGDIDTGLGTLLMIDRSKEAQNVFLYQAMRKGDLRVIDPSQSIADSMLLEADAIEDIQSLNQQTLIQVRSLQSWLGTQSLILKGQRSLFRIDWVDAHQHPLQLLQLEGDGDLTNSDTYQLYLPIDNRHQWPGERTGLQLMDRAEVAQ